MRYLIKLKTYKGKDGVLFHFWELYINQIGKFVYSHSTTIQNKFLAFEFLKRDFNNGHILIEFSEQ